jgi:6-phosphogluconolactonase
MGEDGHIASLFSHSPALEETRRRVAIADAAKLPHRRMTVTPSVISSARQVYVLALGKRKREVYEEALRDPADVVSLPARLVLGGQWIFDTPR